MLTLGAQAQAEILTAIAKHDVKEGSTTLQKEQVEELGCATAYVKACLDNVKELSAITPWFLVSLEELETNVATKVVEREDVLSFCEAYLSKRVEECKQAKANHSSSSLYEADTYVFQKLLPAILAAGKFSQEEVVQAFARSYELLNYLLGWSVDSERQRIYALASTLNKTAHLPVNCDMAHAVSSTSMIWQFWLGRRFC